MMIRPSTLRALALIATMLLMSCQHDQALKHDAAVGESEPGEGYVLVGADRRWVGVTKNDAPSLSVGWRRIGKPMFYQEGVFLQFTDVSLEKLPAGDYYVRGSYFNGKWMWLPELKFRIVPGQVTYVGDFNITVKPRVLSHFVIKRTLDVVDNLESTVAKFKQKYPDVANAHPVRAEVTPISLRDEY